MHISISKFEGRGKVTKKQQMRKKKLIGQILLIKIVKINVKAFTLMKNVIKVFLGFYVTKEDILGLKKVFFS